MVSNQAYLLFYRRRSKLPLGGPRIREIVAKFDNPHDETEPGSTSSATESGEEQRLVADSSLHGSASASTGVEAVHHRDGYRPGPIQTIATQDPPAYQEAMDNDDQAPLLSSHNDEIQDQDSVDKEPLTDESDVSYIMDYEWSQSINHNHQQYHGVFYNEWSANYSVDTNHRSVLRRNSSNGAGSNASDRSDVVAHGSEADLNDMSERLTQFDSALMDEDYVEDEQTTIPDMDIDDETEALEYHETALRLGGQGRVLTVDADEMEVEDEGEEVVDEIHV